MTPEEARDTVLGFGCFIFCFCALLIAVAVTIKAVRWAFM